MLPPPTKRRRALRRNSLMKCLQLRGLFLVNKPKEHPRRREAAALTVPWHAPAPGTVVTEVSSGAPRVNFDPRGSNNWGVWGKWEKEISARTIPTSNRPRPESRRLECAVWRQQARAERSRA